MKKFIVMMMMAAAVFASPLFTTLTSPPGFENTKRLNAGKNFMKTNVDGVAFVAKDVGATMVDKIVISQKDTLLHGLVARGDNKMEVGTHIGGTLLAKANVAVVCQEWVF